MKTIVLIGCSKQKLDREAPARELYTGRLFRLSLRYAEEVLGSGRIGILSAKYGLVAPNFRLHPYDQVLPRARDLLEVWGRQVGPQVASAFGPFVEGDQIVLLAGEPYGMFRRFTPGLGRFPMQEPLRGKQIGERLRWLGRQLEEAR